MSIPVEVGDLGRVLSDFGAGYLVTVSAAGAAKAVTVEPEVVGGALVVREAGRGTLRNVGGNPAVTLIFPPAEARGFTLLIDGAAEVDGDDLRVVPSSAVLHRPGRHADGPPPPPSAGDRGDACKVTS